MPRSFLIKKNRRADMTIKSVDNQADHYQEPTPSSPIATTADGTTAKCPRSGSNVKSTDTISDCRTSPSNEGEASLTLDIKSAITFNHSKTELYDNNTQPFHALYKQQGNGIDLNTGSVPTWKNDAPLKEEHFMFPVAIKQEKFDTDEEQRTSPTTEDAWNTQFPNEAGMPPRLIHHLSLVQHGGRDGRRSLQRLPPRTVEHKPTLAGFLELADGDTIQGDEDMAHSYNRSISPASVESAAGSTPRDDKGLSTSSVSPRKDEKTKATSTKKYRYTCDVCNKSFSRSNTLTTHKRIHTGDKPFICEQCGRAFRQPGNLTRHRLTHTTVKPYVCPQCNKAFNRASNLHTHMRTHTNYKPFTCDFCGKGFHQKIDMKIHRYTHTGEKPHKCDKCGRGFKQLTHLTYHLRTHSDLRMYRCEHCGKGFNQKGNLQAHIYGHTGERPFKCQTCGKGFTLASTLNTHKRTHALKKPFECQFCSKAFYQKNALKTHYIASHPYANGVSLL